MIDRRRRWLNPFALAAVSRAGVQAVTLGAMLLAVSQFDTATFGAYSVAWVTAVIANTVMYSGFYEYLIRTRHLERDKHTVFWMLFTEGSVFFLVMLLVGVASFLFGRELIGTCFLALCSVPLLAAPMAWIDSLLTRQGRAPAVGIVLFVAESAAFLLLALQLYRAPHISALLVWRIVATLITLVGLAYLSRELPKLRWSTDAARSALAAAIPLQGGTSLRTLATYAADLLLALFMSPAASGAYRAAARISITGADVFTQPLRPMSWAAFARHERDGDLMGMRQAYLEQLRLLTFLSWPVLVAVALLSSRIFATFARDEWLIAGPVLALMALSRISSMPDFFVDGVLVCTGRPKVQFYLRTGYTVVLLIGVVLVAPSGALFVAGWQLLAATLMAVVGTILISRQLHVAATDFIIAVIPSLVMCVVCSFAAELTWRLVPLSDPIRLFSSAIVIGGFLLMATLVFRSRGTLRFPGQ